MLGRRAVGSAGVESGACEPASGHVAADTGVGTTRDTNCRCRNRALSPANIGAKRPQTPEPPVSTLPSAPVPRSTPPLWRRLRADRRCRSRYSGSLRCDRRLHPLHGRRRTGDPRRLAWATSEDVLWAAVWVTRSGASTQRHSTLFSRTLTRRSRDGGGDAALLGDPAGFDAIVGALGSEDLLAGSEPPITLQAFALGALTQYVAVLGAVGARHTRGLAAAARSAWAEWIPQNESRWVPSVEPERG